jgi:hypothetical protein
LPGTADDSDNLWTVQRTIEGWSEPEPLPAPINRPESEIDDFDVGDESGPMLLSDGTLIFSSQSDPDWGVDLFVALRDRDGGYLAPRALLLNSYADELRAAISPNGRHLVIHIARSAEGPGGDDLFVATSTTYGWSRPRPLPAPINSPANEGYPAFSPDGRYFFFSSDRGARDGVPSLWYVASESLGLDED